MDQKIKTLKIIHFAVCAGVSVAYFLIGKISIEKLKIQKVDTTEIIYLLIPIAAIFLSNFLFKSQLKQADTKLKIEDNLPIYQTASIIRWVILEGAAFIVLFLKPDLLLLGIAVIVYLIFLHPTQGRIETDFSKLD